MRMRPPIRALAAFGYILLVALVISSVPQYLPEPQPLFAITAFLTLFTFSAAVMGYLFFWQPLELFLAGEKKAASLELFRMLGYFVLLGLTLAAVLVATGTYF